jgi:hypothetical protein
MFLREKRIGAYTYVYLVETVREHGKTKQRIIQNLGRKEVVAAHGDLDRLARSAARLAQRSLVLSLLEGKRPVLPCLPQALSAAEPAPVGSNPLGAGRRWLGQFQVN